MSIQKINQKLLKLWQENKTHLDEIRDVDVHGVPCPIFYEDSVYEEDKIKILFIGLNPSFKKSYLEMIIAENRDKLSLNISDFYKWNEGDFSEKIEQIVLLDTFGRKIKDEGKGKQITHFLIII